MPQLVNYLQGKLAVAHFKFKEVTDIYEETYEKATE